MKSLSESLYLKSPALFQNMALSAYGWHLNRIRHGREYHTFLRNIELRSKSTLRGIATYVDNAIRETIQKAAENVPYYRELFLSRGISPSDIKGKEDLSLLPVLEKAMIMQNPRRFISDGYDPRKLRAIHTTGTTGTPLSIYCNKTARQANYAFYDHFLEENGIRHRGKRATFGGRIVVPAEQTSPPFWRYSRFQKNLLFSSYHLTEKNIPHYINKLCSFRPDVIDTYPSSLYAIVNYARKHEINLNGISGAITNSAETIYPEQRVAIEDSFGVSIYDQYGSAEMCNFVGQCVKGRYHIRTDYAHLEFLRDDGSSAEPGEDAEIICTGFINQVMPLIRYRIGDRGVISEKPCDCGSPFPVLKKLLGRMDDTILTPDGRKVGRMSPVLKGFPVKEAQYVQNDIDKLEIHIIRGPDYNFDTEKRLEIEIRKRVGEKIDIKFKYVEHIERGKGGKFRSIISNIAQ